MNVPQLCHEQGRCIHTSSGYQCVCNAGKCSRSKCIPEHYQYLSSDDLSLLHKCHYFQGYIGNGTYCTEPFRQDHAFLLLSQGVAIVKFPTDSNRGSPIAMSGVRYSITKLCFIPKYKTV